MKYIVNSKEMKICDLNTIDKIGICAEVLMERAALKVVEEIEKRNLHEGKIMIFCGFGNNGGDGFAVARLLYLKGYEVEVVCVGDFAHATKQVIKQLEILQHYGVALVDFNPNMSTNKCDLLIDAVLGNGISRMVEGIYEQAVYMMNQMDCKKVAIDLPTGIDADSGQVMGCAVKCDLTVTFAYKKVGICLYPGAMYAGELVVVDIGMPVDSFFELLPLAREMEDCDRSLIPERKPYSNKGTYGKLLVIAGCDTMSGAAYLSAKAAYLAGCGLVKVLTHENQRQIISTLLPEALVETYDLLLDEEHFLYNLEWADCVLVGPGIGTSQRSKEMVEMVCNQCSIPLIIDADALTIVAQDVKILKQLQCETILTPHVVEMSRLCEDNVEYIKNNLIEVAQEFSKEYNIICVLKDARSMISVPYGPIYINMTGNSGMSTGGSGDVLAGFIAGLATQGMKLEDAAAIGAYFHGKAGDIAAKESGEYSLMANDLLEKLKKVLVLNR